jgi:hypothetical protein
MGVEGFRLGDQLLQGTLKKRRVRDLKGYFEVCVETLGGLRG